MEYRKLGSFPLETPLAQGGMGEILRSVDDLGRPVALKKILKEFQDDPRFRELFERECEITFQLDHPNIVRAYQVRKIANQLVLAMEYLEGMNLKDLLKKLYDGKLMIPMVLVIAIMRRILKGLDYAHKKTDAHGAPLGIVHRDLNPSNVFLTYTGEVKVLDFGISKATTNEVHNLTPKGELRGKICYLSPEQVRGRAVTHRSDIFACGIILYEMLTSRPLFYRQTDGEVMEAIVHADYIPASGYRQDIPAGLEEIIARALSVRPENRFKDCAEFEKALADLSRRHFLPGVDEEEVSIFVRTIFKTGVDESSASFMAGYAWLLTQMPGQERSGLQLIRKLSQERSDHPYVMLNLVRSLITTGNKVEAFRCLKRIARIDSLEMTCQELMEHLGVRRPPVIKFLKRANPLNRALGRVRHRVLGPTPYQDAFLAA